MKTSRLMLIAFISALHAGCVPIPVHHTMYHDPRVKITAGEIFYFPWPLFISRWSHMKVYGRHYAEVRGAEPCYLEIPQINSLLFVTGGNGKAVVHMVNINSHKEINFPAYDS